MVRSPSKIGSLISPWNNKTEISVVGKFLWVHVIEKFTNTFYIVYVGCLVTLA